MVASMVEEVATSVQFWMQQLSNGSLDEPLKTFIPKHAVLSVYQRSYQLYKEVLLELLISTLKTT